MTYDRRKTIALLESASVQLMGIGGIDFPMEEYESLKGKDIIITHRVSDEFPLYMQGDYIRVPWGHIYKCIYRMEIHDVNDSPCYDKLTPAQVRELSGYDNIAVIYLRRNQERHIDDEGIKRIYKEVINDYKKYLKRDIKDVALDITDLPMHRDGTPAPEYIGKSAGSFVKAMKRCLINPYPEIAMRYYGVNGYDNKQKVAEFVYSICAHELAHAMIELGIVNELEINDAIRDAREGGFTTSYLRSFKGNAPRDEIYAEIMADTLVNIRKSEEKNFEFLVKRITMLRKS